MDDMETIVKIVGVIAGMGGVVGVFVTASKWIEHRRISRARAWSDVLTALRALHLEAVDDNAEGERRLRRLFQLYRHTNQPGQVAPIEDLIRLIASQLKRMEELESDLAAFLHRATAKGTNMTMLDLVEARQRLGGIEHTTNTSRRSRNRIGELITKLETPPSAGD